MLVRCYGIQWDTDGEDVGFLPSSVLVEVEDELDAADALSDQYGWCVVSYRSEPALASA